MGNNVVLLHLQLRRLKLLHLIGEVNKDKFAILVQALELREHIDMCMLG